MEIKTVHDKTFNFTSQNATKLFETITTPQAAKYFEQKIKTLLTNAKLLPKLQTVLDDVSKFANDITAMQGNSEAEWQGKMPSFDFQNFQQKIAQSASEQINIEGEIDLYYAVDDESSAIVRGYEQEDGQPLQESTVHDLDSLFNAWFAENGMLTKDGIAYEADDNGKPKVDENDRPILADAEKIKDVIEKLANYVKEEAHLDLNPQEQPFPEEEKERIQQQSSAEQNVSSGGGGGHSS